MNVPSVGEERAARVETMDLEILLITYNRAGYLDRTLSQLHASPFAAAPITVLDNASTDATPAVCERWAERFLDLRVVRHPLNVGGGANFLRAVEEARASYAWILADDDEFDFSDCEDVLAALEEGAVDLIAVGGPDPLDWPPGRTTLRALVEQRRRPFYVFSFVPSHIYRSDLFDSTLIQAGYERVGDVYPQFPFLVRQLERDATVHVCRRQIVHRTHVTVPSSLLWWMVRWVRSCQELGSQERVREGLYELNVRRFRWWAFHLPAAVAIERLEHPERVWDEIRELTRTLRGRLRLLALLSLPIALGPQRLYAGLQRVARRLRREPVRDDVFSTTERPGGLETSIRNQEVAADDTVTHPTARSS